VIPLIKTLGHFNSCVIPSIQMLGHLDLCMIPLMKTLDYFDLCVIPLTKTLGNFHKSMTFSLNSAYLHKNVTYSETLQWVHGSNFSMMQGFLPVWEPIMQLYFVITGTMVF